MEITLDPELASETKALVALAFRNGPIEFVRRHTVSRVQR